MEQRAGLGDDECAVPHRRRSHPIFQPLVLNVQVVGNALELFLLEPYRASSSEAVSAAHTEDLLKRYNHCHLRLKDNAETAHRLEDVLFPDRRHLELRFG